MQNICKPRLVYFSYSSEKNKDNATLFQIKYLVSVFLKQRANIYLLYGLIKCNKFNIHRQKQ